jgi:Terpene synthase family 2, C-terminal metal binding
MTWQSDAPVDGRLPAVDVSAPRAVFCPFPARISPHAARGQRYAVAWATRHGLLPTQRERAAFARARFATLMARAYPEASQADLCLAVCWLTVTFMLDDHLETALGRDPAGQREVADQILGYLDGDRLPDALGLPLAGALDDVWIRTRLRAGAGWRGRLVGHIAEYLAANEWEAENRRRGRVPPLGEYVRMRRQSAATAMFFDLAEALGGHEPATDPDAEAGLALLRRCADNVVAWFNDLVSWPKEAARGDPHNLVLVVHHQLRMPLADAVGYVIDRHDREVRSFVAAGREFSYRRPDRRRLVTGLEHWIRANVDWSRESGRYAAPDDPSAI